MVQPTCFCANSRDLYPGQCYGPHVMGPIWVQCLWAPFCAPRSTGLIPSLCSQKLELWKVGSTFLTALTLPTYHRALLRRAYLQSIARFAVPNYSFSSSQNFSKGDTFKRPFLPARNNRQSFYAKRSILTQRPFLLTVFAKTFLYSKKGFLFKDANVSRNNDTRTLQPQNYVVL